MADAPSAKRARDSDDTAKEDERPAKRIRNINEFDNIITVLVGEEEKRFILHQDLVCTRSKYFRAACSTQWLEGQERTVRLRWADPDAFKAYSSWIYSGRLPKNTCTRESNCDDKHVEKELLVELYILGDKLDDIEMRNEIKRQLLDSMSRQSTLCNCILITRIYESTLPGSLMRRMMVDVTLARQSRPNFAKNISNNPVEFVQDVAMAALETARESDWDKLIQQFEKWEEKAPNE